MQEGQPPFEGPPPEGEDKTPIPYEPDTNGKDKPAIQPAPFDDIHHDTETLREQHPDWEFPPSEEEDEAASREAREHPYEPDPKTGDEPPIQSAPTEEEDFPTRPRDGGN